VTKRIKYCAEFTGLFRHKVLVWVFLVVLGFWLVETYSALKVPVEVPLVTWLLLVQLVVLIVTTLRFLGSVFVVCDDCPATGGKPNEGDSGDCWSSCRVSF